MRKAVAKMVREAAGENLCLVFQPPKSPRVYYPVAIALEVIAVGVPGFRITPSPALFRTQRVWGKHIRRVYRSVFVSWQFLVNGTRWITAYLRSHANGIILETSECEAGSGLAHNSAGP